MKVYVITAYDSNTFEEWVVEVHEDKGSAQQIADAQKELMKKACGNIHYHVDEVDFIQTTGK